MRADGYDRLLLQQQRVQGILVTPVDAESATLDEIRRRGTPVVIVDRTRSDSTFCSVSVDDLLGGRLAIEHLVDRGHERIAFVGGPMALGQVRDRLEGARAAWTAAGRDEEDLTVITTRSLDVAAGREAGARLAGLPSSRRPTAAFCANDLTALGLLQHTIGNGTRVPEDLAIVGYDDIEFAALDEAQNPAHHHRQILFTPSWSRASRRVEWLPLAGL